MNNINLGLLPDEFDLRWHNGHDLTRTYHVKKITEYSVLITGYGVSLKQDWSYIESAIQRGSLVDGMTYTEFLSSMEEGEETDFALNDLSDIL